MTPAESAQLARIEDAIGQTSRRIDERDLEAAGDRGDLIRLVGEHKLETRQTNKILASIADGMLEAKASRAKMNGTRPRNPDNTGSQMVAALSPEVQEQIIFRKVLDSKAKRVKMWVGLVLSLVALGVVALGILKVALDHAR